MEYSEYKNEFGGWSKDQLIKEGWVLLGFGTDENNNGDACFKLGKPPGRYTEFEDAITLNKKNRLVSQGWVLLGSGTDIDGDACFKLGKPEPEPEPEPEPTVTGWASLHDTWLTSLFASPMPRSRCVSRPLTLNCPHCGAVLVEGKQTVMLSYFPNVDRHTWICTNCEASE